MRWSADDASQWWPSPCDSVRAGDVAFDLRDVCGAPGGWREWIGQAIDAARRCPRFDPFDAVSELAVNNPPTSRGTIVIGYPQWVPRMCALRYRFLADFIQPYTLPKQPLPRDDPNLAHLRAAAEQASRTAERAWARYQAALLTKNGLTEPKRSRKRGRRGNPGFRATVGALLRLYTDLFGISPTQTTRGPAARFVEAFLPALKASGAGLPPVTSRSCMKAPYSFCMNAF